MSAVIKRGFNWPEHHQHCETCGDCAPVVELVAESTCEQDDEKTETVICRACAQFVIDMFAQRYGDQP
ncbi:MAG TPA: hypothetical protein VD931_06260 [Baekduia sp.]|nr:hypothetical protein [Baekduia sp.]